jgi:hypothetical protein
MPFPTNPISAFLALWNSGLVGTITARAPTLKADADRIAADLTKIGQDAQKFLADAQPVINGLKGLGT